jgi:WD40 repeat protein
MPQVMVHVDHDGYDYMVEDYEDQIDVGEEAEEILQARERVSLESESDEDEHEVTNVSDTTAAEARRGKDIQGIPWTMLQFTRDKYREQRLLQYKNYENLNRSHEELDKECKSFTKGGKFYEFRHNTRSVKSTYVHFQLRNLVWATSKHDVYLMHSYSVMHWSPLTRKSTEVLNVSGPVVSVTEAKRNPWAHHHHGLGPVQISTMCVKNNLLVAGGFQGEMVCKNLNRPGVAYCAKITHDENAITNAIEIYDDASGGTRLMSSNNDSVVRVFDCEVFSVLSKFEYKWPVNHTSVSPDGKLVVVVGDNTDSLLADTQSGKAIANLTGHVDYSFASAWHPDGYVFATGNQDTTCRLWDARNLSQSLTVLKGRIGAIRSIRFSADGRFMAMAEPADFVHIFDTKQDYNLCQEVDIFGEVAGISFSPDTEALFVGVADRTYGSLLEFNRCHANMYLDSYI